MHTRIPPILAHINQVISEKTLEPLSDQEVEALEFLKRAAQLLQLARAKLQAADMKKEYDE